RPVTVGEDCWLGINAVVTPGVSIGRGCIVGANSVVTRDLPPYTIAAGAPARPIGARLQFSPPSRLDAGSDADLPYFYCGFRQLRISDSKLSLSRVRGGWPASAVFVLAMAATSGDTVELLVDVVSAGTLRHHEWNGNLAPGRHRVSIPAHCEEAEFLRFKWSC